MKSFNFTITPRICVIIGSILFGSTSLSTDCFAQNTGSMMQERNQQSEMAPLNSLLGYYQFPNKVAFIEFKQKDTLLLVKQLWDNKEYELIRINATSFESKNEGHKVEFIKDSSGHFNHAKILGRIMTTKVGFDPKEIIQLTEEQLGRLEGEYILSTDNTLKINVQTSTKGLIIKQMWDNMEITFTPRSETFFLNEDGTFPLTFILNNGVTTQVICFENDIWLKTK